jgi:hypothetical protein
MCVTGLSSRHVAERFQCSPDTVTKYYAPYILDTSSDNISDISRPCSFSFHQILSTARKSSFHQVQLQSQTTSSVTHGSDSLISALAQWTALIFTHLSLQSSSSICVIARASSHKTAFSSATSNFLSYTHSVGGTALWQMQHCGQTHVQLTYKYLKAATSLLTLVSGPATCSLFHTGASDII